jgi:ribonuclease BN (tRNA processing enzyme)
MEPGSVPGVPRHWLARRHLGSVIGMRLTMVGCSGSMPGPHSAASCYLLEADGFRLVVDLGNGAVGALQRYTALNRVDAVALSHLHADHCLDMCPLWIARKYSDEDPLRPIPVYAPAGAAERIARASGHALTYSGDTGESPTLVELARPADVLLCEAGFPDLPDLPPNLHLCGRQAGQHAARAGAGRLILTYLAPDIDPARSLAAAAGPSAA